MGRDCLELGNIGNIGGANLEQYEFRGTRANGGVRRQYANEGSFRDGVDEGDFHWEFSGMQTRIQEQPERELMFAIVTSALLDLSYERDQKHRWGVDDERAYKRRKRAENKGESSGKPGKKPTQSGDKNRYQERYDDKGAFDPWTYIFGPDQDWVFSFENCVFMLGGNPDVIRKAVRNPDWRMAPNQSYSRTDRYKGLNPRMSIGIWYDKRPGNTGGKKVNNRSKYTKKAV